MIVKNESRNMKRVLNSLIGIIDFGSIVDTGSTDNTIEVIENWSKENNIKIVVHKEPFKNFSYNRTHSFIKAKLTFPNADYFLLSDADFIWIKKPGFNKNILDKDFYSIYQGNKHIDYTNIRLISSKHNWICSGLTHEFWEVPMKMRNRDLTTEILHTLYIDDMEDGGCKQDKFIRDERLLLEGLKTEKREDLKIRYKFYLAQTYRDMENYVSAIKYYKENSQESHWDEEIFYAIFMVGECYTRLGMNQRKACFLFHKKDLNQEEREFLQKWKENKTFDELLDSSRENLSQGINYYIKAFKLRINRNEPLIRLSRIFRSLSLYKEAFIVSSIALSIPYPNNDVLFIERDGYKFLPMLEILDCCIYLPNKRDIGKCLLELLLEKDLPHWAKIEVIKKVEAF